MIQSLGHAGLGVSDIDRSIRFYRDLLGMEVIMELDISDDRISRVIGVTSAKCRISHLKLGDGMLELFEYTNPKGQNKARDMQQYDHGLIHIGFEVNDIHGHLEELEKNNVELLGELVEFRPDVFVAYFKGPDGEVCEMRQIPK